MKESIMRKLASADFLSGIVCVAFGAAFILAAAQYELGSAAAMGPGYFPTCLGALLVVFGLALIIKSLFDGVELVSPSRLRPALIVLGSFALFAVLLDRLGLVLSGLAFLYAVSRATDRFTTLQLGVFSASLTLFASLLFIYGLGVPLAPWPAF